MMTPHENMYIALGSEMYMKINYGKWNEENNSSICTVKEGIAKWKLSLNLNFMFIMFTHISKNNL